MNSYINFFPDFTQQGFDARHIEEQILSYLPPNTEMVCRVSNFQLYVRMAKVCNRWRLWVFDSNIGPFASLKGHNITPQQTQPRPVHLFIGSPVHLFIGSLNQVLEQRAVEWFEYLEARDTYTPTLMYPADFASQMDANVYNYAGDTVLDKALHIALYRDSFYRIFKELGEKATLKTFMKALPKVFEHESRSNQPSKEWRFTLADYLIEKIMEKSGGSMSSQDILKDQVNHILYSYGDTAQTLDWLQKWNLSWDVAGVISWLRSAYGRTLEIFKRLIIELKQCGDSNVQKIPLMLLTHQALSKRKLDFFNYLWQEGLIDLNYRDDKGESMYFHLFLKAENTIIVDALKNDISTAWLWEIRMPLFNKILDQIKAEEEYLLFRVRDMGSRKDIGNVFLHIAKLFPTAEEFHSWIALENANISMLHTLAFWLPSLFLDIKGLRTVFGDVDCRLAFSQDLMRTNDNGMTVIALALRQERLIDFFLLIDRAQARDEGSWGYDGRFNVVEKLLASSVDQKELRQFFEELSDRGCPHGIYPILERTMIDLKNDRYVYDNTEILKYLLEIFDPNTSDENGNTLIHNLLLRCKQDVSAKKTLTLLIDHGVDPTLVNNANKTALDIAKERNLTSMIPFFG